MEEWKPIPSTNGHYEASSWGQIRSTRRVVDFPDSERGPHTRVYRGRVIKSWVMTKKGYRCVRIRIRGVSQYVHHLVLEAFVGPRPHGMECRHLDGDPANNRIDNLAWGTHSENEQDKFRHGTRKARRCPTPSKINSAPSGTPSTRAT